MVRVKYYFYVSVTAMATSHPIDCSILYIVSKLTSEIVVAVVEFYYFGIDFSGSRK